MGKNKKGVAVPPAPKTEKVETVEPEVINENKTVRVIDANGLKDQILNTDPSTLDANHRVEVLMGLDRHFMQPNAAEKLGVSEETVKSINMITAHGWVAAMASEVAFGKSDFASKLRASALPTIIEAGKNMGITFDQKLLPPAVEGVVEIPSNAVKISKEAKKALEEEKKIAESDPVLDPTKIGSEDELKATLLFIMTNRANAYEKLHDAISFYRAYNDLQAAENKDDKAKSKNMSDAEVLNKIKTLLGSCPFVLNGMGRTMATFTSTSKSPVPAFCMFRNSTKNKQTGIPAVSDKEVADYVRVLIDWAIELQIADYKKRIKSHEENLKALSKDKKANEKGIKDVTEKIEACKASVAHLNEVIDLVVNPSSESADSLLTKIAEKDRGAQTIYNHIVGSYYADVDITKVEPATVKHNVQQYAGIILNMFRDPVTPILEYSEANILDIESSSTDEEGAEQPKKD